MHWTLWVRMTSHSEYRVSKEEGLELSHVGYQHLMLGEEKPKRKQEKPCRNTGGKNSLKAKRTSVCWKRQ